MQSKPRKPATGKDELLFAQSLFSIYRKNILALHTVTPADADYFGEFSQCALLVFFYIQSQRLFAVFATEYFVICPTIRQSRHIWAFFKPENIRRHIYKREKMDNHGEDVKASTTKGITCGRSA